MRIIRGTKIVAFTNEIVLVVYRGTVPSSLKNWITDLNFPQTTPYPNVPGAMVHEGFLEACITFSSV